MGGAGRNLPRGFSLLFVCTMVVVLSFGATMLLRQVQDVGMMVGARQRATRSEQAARAAVSIATRLLNDALFADSGGGAMSLTKVRAMPPLAADDELCADGIDCTDWHLLGDHIVVGTEGARGRAAVTCNPGGCDTAAEDVLNFQVRARSKLAGGGSGQLVEVYVEVDDN